MSRVFLPIDTKSLYCNIFNDNEKGHTCTVATPIRQRSSINKELEEIYSIPEQLDAQTYPDLIEKIIQKSKSKVKVNQLFVFRKLKVNGIEIETSSYFCMFTKEEVDPARAQFGRIKLHYPLSLKYEEIGVDNRAVMMAISSILHDYAFIIRGFEYDFETGFLNFRATIVGYEQIPYSKVFINTKGVGAKFSKSFQKNLDCYDLEIVALKHKYGEGVDVDNYGDYIVKAKSFALEQIVLLLAKEGASNIYCLSDDYPYSAFDIEYVKDDKTHYAIVKATYTKLEYVDLTSDEYRFLNLFDDSELFLVKDVFGQNKISLLNTKDLESFRSDIRSIRLTKEGA